MKERKRGRGKWHIDRWQENHETLKKILLQAKFGITKIELHRKTGLSRRRINKHLKTFGSDVISEERKLFWRSNYEETWHYKEWALERYYKIINELQPLFDQLPQRLSPIFDDAFHEMFEEMRRDLLPRIDKEYRARVKQLGYEVVGDWEGLRKIES